MTAFATAPAAWSLEEARRIILAAYPEFAVPGARASVELAPTAPWDSVPLLRALLYPRDDSAGSPASLAVLYRADPDGALHSFIATGSFVFTERRHELAGEVERLAMDDRQIRDLLERSSARFSPPTVTPAAAARNVERFRTVLGDLRVMSTTFEYRTEADRREDRRASMLWRIRTERRQGGRHDIYWFGFEPFEGRLVKIVRGPHW